MLRCSGHTHFTPLSSARMLYVAGAVRLGSEEPGLSGGAWLHSTTGSCSPTSFITAEAAGVQSVPNAASRPVAPLLFPAVPREAGSFVRVSWLTLQSLGLSPEGLRLALRPFEGRSRTATGPAPWGPSPPEPLP